MQGISIVVFLQRQLGYVSLILLFALPLSGQGIRERIRAATPGTKVSEAQAADLTLTLGTASMGYSFIYVILDKAARRDQVQQLVQDRISTIRPQLPSDASVSLGPNASSMVSSFHLATILPACALHGTKEA